MDLILALLERVSQTRRALAEDYRRRVWEKIGLDGGDGQCARTTHGNEDTDDLGPDRWPNLHLSRN